VLTGAPSSYSALLNKEASSSLQNVGKDTLLVTAVQGRNNARAVFSGSIDLFSNEHFSTTLSTTGQVRSTTRMLGARTGRGFADRTGSTGLGMDSLRYGKASSMKPRPAVCLGIPPA
jgi:hypothetical protein